MTTAKLTLSTKAKWGISWVLLGVSLTTMVNAWVQREFENEILDSIIERINPSKSLSEEALIEKTIHTAFFLQERRTMIAGKHNFKSLKTKFFTSSLESFYVGTGACGYYSIFATRLLKRQGFQPKIVQQRSNGIWGAHITVAIPLKNGRLGLVDPLYNHVFKDPNGQIADIKSVVKNWQFYDSKVPTQYKKQYNYQEGYRHTNWDKFGFISMSIYKAGCILMGKKSMDLISLRTFFIDPYEIVFYVSMAVSVLIGFGIWRIGKSGF